MDKTHFIILLSFPYWLCRLLLKDRHRLHGNLETLLLVVLSFVLIVAILILIIGLYLVSIIKMILLEDKKQKAAAEGKEYVPEVRQSWWNKLMNKASDVVPVEKKRPFARPQLRWHSELDNHLPPWWKWLFTLPLSGVSFICWFIMYLMSLPLMHEEYEIVMEDAKAAKEAMMALAGNNIDENNVEFRTTIQPC
jgi:cytochrome c oxidase cbb3-type subunit III